MSAPKYPDVHGDVFGPGTTEDLVRDVARDLLAYGADQREVDMFVKQATASDNFNLLRVVSEWVDVEYRPPKEAKP